MALDTPHILLVNPWIHDFAAYDFWAKPLGLLRLTALLRRNGYRVSFIDCLDRFHPSLPTADGANRFGRGPYPKTPIEKPAALGDIPRTFSRYGIDPDGFMAELQKIPRPDLVLVTSLMTYWYPGVVETIQWVKDAFPETAVVLGGVYATLCTGHAVRCSGADEVIPGGDEPGILARVNDLTGFAPFSGTAAPDGDRTSYPAFDLYRRFHYVALQTTTGCPYRCAYCASRVIQPVFRRRDPDAVVEEIKYWQGRFGVDDFVFYDDALLADADTHARLLFERVIKEGLRVRFHTPNALHVREITPKIARLMFESGFKTVRLGLETASFKQRKKLDRKLTRQEFQQAVNSLRQAGFHQDQVGAYLLAGLPNQSMDEVADSIRAVLDAGITPVPAYYSPIPHTDLWPEAVAASRYNLASDPIYTNNAILPCRKEPFSWKDLTRIKQLARGERA